MITEDFCSFEVAKLLKEKGFDELCIFKYNSEGVRMKAGVAIDEWQNSELDDDEYSCPSQSMAMKWLREVHKIFIEVSVSIDLNGNYHYSYTVLDKECKYLRRGYTDFDWNYEDAVEAALKYALENLI